METTNLNLKEIMKLRNNIEMRDKLSLALGNAEKRIAELESIVEKYSEMREKLMKLSKSSLFHQKEIKELQDTLNDFIV